MRPKVTIDFTDSPPAVAIHEACGCNNRLSRDDVMHLITDLQRALMALPPVAPDNGERDD